MNLNPILSFDLAHDHDRSMIAEADARRALEGGIDVYEPSASNRSIRVVIGRLMIAIGERVSGVNLPKPTDLASSPQ